jgi:hypothetical protein
MADTLVELVDNMDIEGGADGSTSPEPSTGTDKVDGGGTDDSGSGSKQPSDEPTGEGATEGGQGSDTGSDPEPETGSDDSGYVADELDDDGEPEPPAPDTNTPPAALTPELQYVVDRLPTLTVRSKDGQTYQVKAAGQLPDNFEFANKREELTFTQAIAAQEFKAQGLLNEYNNKQATEQSKKYVDQENADIRSDMSDLQREGLLPRFNTPPNDRKFADDPGVKAAQEVLDYMNDRNTEYTRQGKLYRISYRDAFEQLARNRATSPKTQAQATEDSQRKTATRQLSSSRTAPSNPAPKARISRSMEDLMAKIDAMDFA